MTSLELPVVRDMDEFERALEPQHDAMWLSVARVLADRHGLTGPIARFTTGSSPVLSIGAHHVVKLIAPLFHDEFVAERGFLAAIAGALTIATPELVATGEFNGWSYLVLTRIPGAPIRDVWPQLDVKQRCAVAEQIGVGMAELHAVPLGIHRPRAQPWSAFVQQQQATAARRHEARGLPRRLVCQIPDFLANALRPDDLAPDCEVLLSGDIHHDHVFLVSDGDTWRISGFIDFADALVGARLYEFAAPTMFITRNQPEPQHALYTGYGVTARDRDQTLSARLLAFTLLHRFGDLNKYLRWMPPERHLDTLDDVAVHLWPP